MFSTFEECDIKLIIAYKTPKATTANMIYVLAEALAQIVTKKLNAMPQLQVKLALKQLFVPPLEKLI